jgi:hypothetical protein
VVADTVRVNGAEQPTTLEEAHELVRRLRPEQDAEPLMCAAYHRRNSEIYALVALLNPEQRREAQQHAGQELRFARDIEDELDDHSPHDSSNK